MFENKPIQVKATTFYLWCKLLTQAYPKLKSGNSGRLAKRKKLRFLVWLKVLRSVGPLCATDLELGNSGDVTEACNSQPVIVKTCQANAQPALRLFQ